MTFAEWQAELNTRRGRALQALADGPADANDAARAEILDRYRAMAAAEEPRRLPWVRGSNH
jgi:hypothetical protein